MAEPKCDCEVFVRDGGFAYSPEVPQDGVLEIHYCELHKARPSSEDIRKLVEAERAFDRFMGLFPEFLTDMNGAEKKRALAEALKPFEQPATKESKT